MEYNMRRNNFFRLSVHKMIVIAVLIFIVLFYMYSIRIVSSYEYEYVLNAFTGLMLLIGTAYLCYPWRPGEDRIKKEEAANFPVSKKYKLVSGSASTFPQYFLSDMEAWNVLRKQIRISCLGYAILYTYENCRLTVVRHGTLPEERDVNYWKPVCIGKVWDDFSDNI